MHIITLQETTWDGFLSEMSQGFECVFGQDPTCYPVVFVACISIFANCMFEFCKYIFNIRGDSLDMCGKE